jgi:predicted Rossmann fold flavoprotein
MPPREVVVVGAGAAGILAAWRAASYGANVTLLEKTSRLGTKILISGGGKCNITHDGPIEDLLRAFKPNEARFLRPACYRFKNSQIIEMLTSQGLDVYTRPDGRIFPVHQTAKDVVEILSGYLNRAHVRVCLESAVTGIETERGTVRGVRFGSQSVPCDVAIVASGGSSYPRSGTTGDGWTWMRELGHTIVKIRPALAPIYLVSPFPEMSGVAMRDCVLKARLNGKELTRWRGDLLLTHDGVSGPTALGISRDVGESLGRGDLRLEVDIAPQSTYEELGEASLQFASAHPRRSPTTFVSEFVPDRLVPLILSQAVIQEGSPWSRIDRKARNRIVAALKAWDLGAVKAVPLEKGEVVAGGVSLDEVDPHTMRSRKIDGLSLCGEVLDVAGPVGGYNLQAAFATGYVAGEEAAKS